MTYIKNSGVSGEWKTPSVVMDAVRNCEIIHIRRFHEAYMDYDLFYFLSFSVMTVPSASLTRIRYIPAERWLMSLLTATIFPAGL